mmetsp:Transcript_27859/g.67725  ORF Transcript_27859/g.67725 Transcript_27859/m.67725 type:complete len:948 (-) Transcript_27859:175-3018(-)|eukprot:CAMPEP_0114501980 /NCGR_PEP_ID=MMETSP0109-20121206/8798_1 /TAXON_ID=29199 /ORGANISM="Chlorarachnion reptans, Strain CCCM449" /LENGTH=947 /DNA_ID=CAMNT_0001679767 /DNA_START=164 /DNA_END=3007 /DNA_ORIENTATION=+
MSNHIDSDEIGDDHQRSAQHHSSNNVINIVVNFLYDFLHVNLFNSFYNPNPNPSGNHYDDYYDYDYVHDNSHTHVYENRNHHRNHYQQEYNRNETFNPVQLRGSLLNVATNLLGRGSWKDSHNHLNSASTFNSDMHTMPNYASQESMSPIKLKAYIIFVVAVVEYFALWLWLRQNKRVVRHKAHRRKVKQMAARQILLPFFETIVIFSLLLTVFRGMCVIHLVENHGEIKSLEEWADLEVVEILVYALLLMALQLFQVSFVPMYLLETTIGAEVYKSALWWSSWLSGGLFLTCIFPPAFSPLSKIILDHIDHKSIEQNVDQSLKTSSPYPIPHSNDDDFTDGYGNLSSMGSQIYHVLHQKHVFAYPAIGYLSFVAFGCICMLVRILQYKNPRWGCQLQSYVTVAAAYYIAIVWGLIHLHPTRDNHQPPYSGGWKVGGKAAAAAAATLMAKRAERAREVIAWADSLMAVCFPFLLWLTLREEAQWWRSFAMQVMGMGRHMPGVENIPIQTAHQMLQGHLSMIDFPELEFLGRGGSGASGAVYRCRYQGKLVAAKGFVEKAISIPELLRVAKEAFLCHRIRHPNVVEFLGMCVSPPNLYLVFEWCTHRSLLAMLLDLSNTKLSWRTRVRFALEVAKGLTALHTLGVVHRDVKTENVLVTLNSHGRFTCKLCDFGSSRLIQTLNASLSNLPTPKHQPMNSSSGMYSGNGIERKFERPSQRHDRKSFDNGVEGKVNCYQYDGRDVPKNDYSIDVKRSVPNMNSSLVAAHRSHPNRVFGNEEIAIHSTKAWQEDNFLTGLVGTPAYMAPELLANIHCGRNAITALSRKVFYGLPVDVFSFGYVMWELLTRQQVYSSKKFSFKEIHKQVLEGERPSIPSPMSAQLLHKDFVTLIHQCWQARPGRRPDVKTLARKLKNIYAKIKKIQKHETPAVGASKGPIDSIDYQPLARQST